MSEVTLKCSKCSWSTTKPNKNAAEASMRMHVGRMHGNVIPGHQGGAKKKRTKRSRKTEENTPNYCPNCGLNLKLLAMSMDIAGTM